MGAKTSLPVVRLELSSGVFRINTDEAIYEIAVNPEGGPARVVEKIIEKEVPVPATAPPPPPPPEPAEEPVAAEPAPEEAPAAAQEAPAAAAVEADQFYKEISEEMLQEIGKLAREMSISIQEMPPADEMKQVDIQRAGFDLESAKGLLDDVVKMTEKATMEIMDISENIQDDCETIQQNLADLKNLKVFENEESAPAAGSTAAPAGAASIEVLEELLQHEHNLKEVLVSLPAPSAAPTPAPEPTEAPEPVTKTVQVYSFDLDVLFQTLYELCTNEAVKKHIKAMREAQTEEFSTDDIQQSLSDMAPEVEVEDTFYNFPLPALLKMLFQYTTSDKNKQILKKMNQTASTIFLDQILPVEGTVEEKEITVEPEPAPVQDEPAAEPSGDDPLQEAFQLIDKNIALLTAEADRLRQIGDEGGGTAAEDGGAQTGFSVVKKEDHEKLVATLESSDQVIRKIVESIRQILEALSFQDLSGQRIVKIADMLTNVQFQLLSILVSFGVKLKSHQQHADSDDWDSDEEASEEVSKMMSRVKEEVDGEAEASPLDQGEVDKLLAELGF